MSGPGTYIALVVGMIKLDSAQLANVTGGQGTWSKIGSALKQTGQGLSEGWSLAKGASKIDEFHPANPSTFAEYNAKREMHQGQ